MSHHCGIENNANGIGLFDLDDALLRLILFDWCTLLDLKKLHSVFCTLNDSDANPVVSWNMRTRRGTLEAARIRFQRQVMTQLSRAKLNRLEYLLADPKAPFSIDLGLMTYKQGFQCWFWMSYRGIHIKQLKYVDELTTTDYAHSSQFRRLETLTITHAPATSEETARCSYFIQQCLTLKNVNLCHCSSPNRENTYHEDIITALPATVEYFCINMLTGSMLRRAVASIPSLLGLTAKKINCNPSDILAIASFTNLRRLALTGFAITSEDAQTALVAVLRALGYQLQAIELDHAVGAYMNGTVVDAITHHCTQLDTVRLMVENVEDGRIKRLVNKMKQTLRHVSLDGGHVYDLPFYDYDVFASNSVISDISIEVLIEACCSTLATLALRSMHRITDKAFTKAYGQPTLGGLKSLILINLNAISDATLTALANNGCHALEELQLSSLQAVTDTGVQALLRANIHLTKVKLEALRSVTHLTIQTLLAPTTGRAKLVTLILVSIHHVNELETYAAQLSNLTTLVLKDMTMVSDNGDALNAIAMHCNYLSRLEFTSMDDITDDGIEALVTANKMLRSVSFASVPNIGNNSLNALVHYCPLIARAKFISCQHISMASYIDLLVWNSQIQYLDDLHIEDCHHDLYPMSDDLILQLENNLKDKRLRYVPVLEEVYY